MPPRSPSWTEAINPCQSTSASLFQQDDNACLTLIQRAWGGWRAPPPAEERVILHTDLRAGASPTLTTPGFHRTAGICTRSRFLVKKATTSTFWRSEGTRDITIKREGEMGIIQPCILGSCRPVRPVWMPGRGQGSPLICHRNCWCRTSRVSRSVSVDLSLSPCFHTCSLYLTLSLLCRSDFTLSLSLSPGLLW